MMRAVAAWLPRRPSHKRNAVAAGAKRGSWQAGDRGPDAREKRGAAASERPAALDALY